MWQALRQEAFNRAIEARKRAEKVAEAARELLEDARAALEVADEDDTESPEEASVSKAMKQATSLQSSVVLPLRAGDALTRSNKPAKNPIRPVELQTETYPREHRSPATTTDDENGSSQAASIVPALVQLPKAVSAEPEGAGSTLRRPKRRVLGARPLGASAVKSSADEAPLVADHASPNAATAGASLADAPPSDLQATKRASGTPVSERQVSPRAALKSSVVAGQVAHRASPDDAWQAPYNETAWQSRGPEGDAQAAIDHSSGYRTAPGKHPDVQLKLKPADEHAVSDMERFMPLECKEAAQRAQGSAAIHAHLSTVQGQAPGNVFYFDSKAPPVSSETTHTFEQGGSSVKSVSPQQTETNTIARRQAQLANRPISDATAKGDPDLARHDETLQASMPTTDSITMMDSEQVFHTGTHADPIRSAKSSRAHGGSDQHPPEPSAPETGEALAIKIAAAGAGTRKSATPPVSPGAVLDEPPLIHTPSPLAVHEAQAAVSKEPLLTPSTLPSTVPEAAAASEAQEAQLDTEGSRDITAAIGESASVMSTETAAGHSEGSTRVAGSSSPRDARMLSSASPSEPEALRAPETRSMTPPTAAAAALDPAIDRASAAVAAVRLPGIGSASVAVESPAAATSSNARTVDLQAGSLASADEELSYLLPESSIPVAGPFFGNDSGSDRLEDSTMTREQVPQSPGVSSPPGQGSTTPSARVQSPVSGVASIASGGSSCDRLAAAEDSTAWITERRRAADGTLHSVPGSSRLTFESEMAFRTAAYVAETSAEHLRSAPETQRPRLEAASTAAQSDDRAISPPAGASEQHLSREESVEAATHTSERVQGSDVGTSPSAGHESERVIGHQDEIASIAARYAAAQKEAEHWAVRYEALHAEYILLQTEVEKLREHCLEQESNTESLEEALEQALEQLRIAKEEQEASRRAETSASTKMVDLQRSMASLEKRLLEFEERERRLTTALTAMQQSHEAALARNQEQHRTQLSEIERRLLRSELALQEKDTELSALRARLEQTEAELVAARAENAQLTDTLAECRATLEEAQTRVARLSQERNWWKMLMLRQRYRPLIDPVLGDSSSEHPVYFNAESGKRLALGEQGDGSVDTQQQQQQQQEPLVPELLDVDQVIESTAADEPVDRPFLRQLLLVFLLSEKANQRREALDLLLRMLQCTEAERSQALGRVWPRSNAVSLGREFVRFLLRETEPDPQRDTDTGNLETVPSNRAVSDDGSTAQR
ncbi:hypothetical protein, conserved [Cyanidioschyzon merolae strain 10D]|uniref:GRIP domain-containing protein n=1 Tax=Cyanidioschyzon merolae (strain NIES-3377 / 10D) TaxID=280699 RepID=M1UPZ0_CYAM1|nr:hypothetical protein, conserved [Cyanidioschyzon merolae strain 10D]BAM79551.1 hypothetical protein, conserved [Cyanidioschyzon merolae strain 10D]|eukprot:XP_005535837.1 hypothetical protein, conserved [Cyanidioschyzon merolae strain 10D]